MTGSLGRKKTEWAHGSGGPGRVGGAKGETPGCILQTLKETLSVVSGHGFWLYRLHFCHVQEDLNYS